MLIKYWPSFFWATIVFANKDVIQHHDVPVRALIFHSINLIIFASAIYFFAGKQIGKMFFKRAEDMESDLRNSENEMKKINADISEYSLKLKKIESEQDQIRLESEKLKNEINSKFKLEYIQEEKRLIEENKKQFLAEDLRQQKSLKESLVGQVLQMARNELTLKAKSKDVHFNMRQELQENIQK